MGLSQELLQICSAELWVGLILCVYLNVLSFDQRVNKNYSSRKKIYVTTFKPQNPALSLENFANNFAHHSMLFEVLSENKNTKNVCNILFLLAKDLFNSKKNAL